MSVSVYFSIFEYLILKPLFFILNIIGYKVYEKEDLSVLKEICKDVTRSRENEIENLENSLKYANERTVMVKDFFTSEFYRDILRNIVEVMVKSTIITTISNKENPITLDDINNETDVYLKLVKKVSYSVNPEWDKKEKNLDELKSKSP